MSKVTHPYSFGLPEGRRLVQDGDDGLADGVVFSVSRFPRVTAKRVEAAREFAREIPDERLDRSTDPWRDRETGEEFELVRSWFNIVDPASSGAVAFTVSDGNILGLRGGSRRSSQPSSATCVRVWHEAPARIRAQARQDRQSGGSLHDPA
jgi:hypothetical protein